MTEFKQTTLAVVFIGWMGVTGISHAALYNRGNGLVYDSKLDITWTLDANLLGTLESSNPNLVSQIISANNGVIHDTPNRYDNGSHPLTVSDFRTGTGEVTWWGAQAWVGYLNSQNYQGYNNWRLPTVTDIGAVGCDSFAYSGSDCGWNVDTSTSELAYMFHVNLNNQSVVDPSGQNRPSYNYIANSSFQDAARGNVADRFNNLQSMPYWSGSEYAPNPDEAWDFYFSYGTQVDQAKNADFMYAWAVRPGDVAAVPVPGAVWLMGSGLLGLLSLKRRWVMRSLG